MMRWAMVTVGGPLAACTPTPAAENASGNSAAIPAPSAGCDASRVQDVIGKPRSEALAEDARKRAGAATVRYLTPDMIVTMEYRADRLNLHVGADGRIGSARCG